MNLSGDAGDALGQRVALRIGDGAAGGPALGGSWGAVTVGAEEFVGLSPRRLECGGGPATTAVALREVLSADLAMAVRRFPTAVVAWRAGRREERYDAMPLERRAQMTTFAIEPVENILALRRGGLLAWPAAWPA